MIGLLAACTQLLLRPVLKPDNELEERLAVELAEHKVFEPGVIPEPCWYPLFAGAVWSSARPASKATLRLCIHNGGPTARKFGLTSDGAVDFEPATLTVKPRQTAEATATFTVAADASEGDKELLQLRVRGCRAHDVDWRVKAAKHAKPAELEIDDRPDYLHHWYDHFYYAHPCLPERRR